MITPEYLHKLLIYKPRLGVLLWRKRPVSMFASERDAKVWNARYANKPALCSVTEKGYLHGRIFNKAYRQHRVIFAMMTGRWPDQVDHKNGKRADNRWANLREVNSHHQARNKKMRTDNTSGVVGVGWSEKEKRWVSRIGKKRIGAFKNKDDAVAARKKAAKNEYHPNHGRIV